MLLKQRGLCQGVSSPSRESRVRESSRLPVPVRRPSLREFTGLAQQQGTKSLRMWLIFLLNLKFKLIFGGCFFCFSFQLPQRYCCVAGENKPETKKLKKIPKFLSDNYCLQRRHKSTWS